MSSINNNNQKNQVDTTDLEFGSFNEEEDQFINKKQLVHIEDDTSINVDMSEDDRSKSSSFKKSFLINNISALNEQFPNSNQLNNKKNENYNENEINDLTNSADFYNNQNVLGDIPESNEERNKNENINNDEVIQSLETKIDNNGYFFSRKNKQILENNINNNYKNLVNNKKITLKNTNNDNLSIKDIDNEEVEEEEDKDNINNKNNIRTSQMMVKKNLTPNEIINKYINNQNINNYNEEFLQNNLNSNGNKYPNLNSNDFNTDSYQQENFYFNIINTNSKFSGSVNSSEQTFGLIQSREFQNKYAQLEAKYNSLLAQNKNLEANYQELKNSNKSVLDLLTYWQKFYLEILEIVKPKNENKNSDNSISDYMDDPYRIQVINEVKKIVLIARDKAYNKFYISSPIRLDIKRIENIIDNKKTKEKINDVSSLLSMKQIESFYVKGNVNKIEEKKNNNEDNSNNSSSSIKYKEKINIGTNTEINNEKVSNMKNKYDKKKLKISSKVQNISYIHKIQKKTKSNNSNEVEIKVIKNKFNKLNINSDININYKGNSQKNQKKFKKNIMHKIAIIQTDMTCKNINSLETLNKACSSQLLNAQKEKEKMQKLYEEKISSLNNYINENIKPAKKEKENKSKNKEKKKEKIKEEEVIKEKEQKEKEDMVPNLNSSFIFLPEMIPPENTYKIFMHCVKHFKYEEDIYKKYLEEEDLYTLRSFVEKMEKYLTLSLLKNKKAKKENKYKERKDKNNIIINNDNFDIYDNEDMNEENISQKRQKDNNMYNTKQKFSNAKSKLPNNSENKKSNIYNNNNTFNKYKAAIMALKD